MPRTIIKQKKKPTADMRRRTKRAHARKAWLNAHRRRHYVNLPESKFSPEVITMWLTFDREDEEIERRQVRQFKERAAHAATWNDDNDPLGHEAIERYNATMGILGLYQEPFDDGDDDADELAEWERELLYGTPAPKLKVVAAAMPAPKPRVQLPKHLRVPECEERPRLSYAAQRRTR